MIYTAARATYWQVPSGFLIADGLLILDQKLEQHLLIPKHTQEKKDIAGREARRLKKLLGSLRHLWRNSAFSKQVQYELQLLFCKRPSDQYPIMICEMCCYAWAGCFPQSTMH